MRAAWFRSFPLLQSPLVAAAILLLAAATASAQDNYEIQVYASETVPPRALMVELHSNFTAEGTTTSSGGLYPTNHALHETLELTYGFNSIFETGFYIFTSARDGNGWQYVGSHIRPRICAPQKWRLPFGLSLSGEVGYQRRQFSEDTWTLELRPIVDKKMGRWYASFNPTLDRALHGPNTARGFEFSPNVKISYDVTPKIAAGLEYYAALGPITGFDALSNQQQQFFPAIDLNLSPVWEFNFGVGVGATRSTDHLIIKAILGRRFSFQRGARQH